MPSREELALVYWIAVTACTVRDGKPPAIAGHSKTVAAPIEGGSLNAAATAEPESPLCPAFALASPHSDCSGPAPSKFGVMVIEKSYVCGELLQGTGNLLNLWRDPWTGMPYDTMPCGGPYARRPIEINPASGVVPQLAFADISVFAEDNARAGTTVDWEFVDRAPDDTLPSLLWALRITLRFDQGRAYGAQNRFGGLIWRAKADISRYAQVRIRYRTSEARSTWQLKLGSGTTQTVEPAVILPGSTAWTDRTFAIPSDFPGTDASQLNQLVFASTAADSGPNPSIWIDQLSFVAMPSRLADCDVSCPSPLPAYPDLACYEPQTGPVDLANALSFLATASAAGLLDAETAKTGAMRLLASLESLPGARAGTRANGQPYPGGGWFQDWHSPVSLMPNPNNRTSSPAAQSQLFAALMVVETTWPDLAARAAVLRSKMDFSVLYDERSGCPGKLLASIDRCAGLPSDQKDVDGFGTDHLLGAFLAEATKATPLCFWTSGLSGQGCQRSGPERWPWYKAGDLCANAEIPGSDGGGPFQQLAGLLYLASDQIPMGPLSLGASADNMLRAQYEFARENNLALAGWSNASDPDACATMTCTEFAPEKVTPYPSAMATSDAFPETYHMLRAFHLLGADACLNTGSDVVALGFHDGFNQADARARSSYRYSHAGWTELGLLNACRDGLIRQRFGEHPVARAGYARLQSGPPPCP